MEPENQNNFTPPTNAGPQAVQPNEPYPDNSLATSSTNEQAIPQQSAEGGNLKKNKKTRTVVEAVVLFVVLAVIIGFVVAINLPPSNDNTDQALDYDQSEQDETSEDQQSAEKVEKPATTPEGLLDCSQIQNQAEIDVCKTISAVAEYLADRYSPTEGQIVLDYNYSNYGPIYKLDYLTVATGSIPGHKAYRLSSKYRNQETPVRDYLLTNGFEETTIMLQDPFNEGAKNSLFINPSTGVICSGETVVECANMAWYPAEGSDTALLLNDLANVLASQPDITVTASDILSIGDIKDSEISPYQTVTGSFNNGGVSFYRVSPNSEWLFGYIAQSILSCEYYNNVDMRNAYASEQCQPDGSATITTVKEYYNL